MCTATLHDVSPGVGGTANHLGSALSQGGGRATWNMPSVRVSGPATSYQPHHVASTSEHSCLHDATEQLCRGQILTLVGLGPMTRTTWSSTLPPKSCPCVYARTCTCTCTCSLCTCAALQTLDVHHIFSHPGTLHDHQTWQTQPLSSSRAHLAILLFLVLNTSPQLNFNNRNAPSPCLQPVAIPCPAPSSWAEAQSCAQSEAL